MSRRGGVRVGLLESVGRADRFSVLALVLANAGTALGVVVGGWSIGSVLAIYWLESAVIGLWTIVKMVMAPLMPANYMDRVRKMVAAQGGDAAGVDMRRQLQALNAVQHLSSGWMSHLLKLFIIPFFCFHFGMFMFGHGVFILLLAGDAMGRSSSVSMDPASVADGMLGVLGSGAVAVVALFVSHGVSFVRNHIMAGERQRLSAPEIMFQPYARIIVMHLTILFGMFLVLATGGGTAALLVLLIVCKTVADVLAHARQHVRLHVSQPALAAALD